MRRNDRIVTHDVLYVYHYSRFIHDGVVPRTERTDSQRIMRPQLLNLDGTLMLMLRMHVSVFR